MTSSLKGLERVVKAADRLPDDFAHVGQSKDPPTIRNLQSFEALLSLAKAAPFGQGDTTLVDETVRRTLQIQLPHPKVNVEWPGLQDALQEAAKNLLLSKPLHKNGAVRLEATLDKLLIYRPGDFFKTHRDSKKSVEHIMTLSAVCRCDEQHQSSPWNGGSVCFERGATWEGKAAGDYACWFNTERHSVAEVKSGHRVVLQYNVSIVSDDGGSDQNGPSFQLPVSPSQQQQQMMINQSASPLINLLPIGLMETMILENYLCLQDLRNLSMTCQSFRNLTAPEYLFASLLRECKKDILSSLQSSTSNPTDTLGLLFYHPYSFDGNLHVNPIHLRGRDAIVYAAFTNVFGEEAFLTTRKATIVQARPHSYTYEEREEGFNPEERIRDNGARATGFDYYGGYGTAHRFNSIPPLLDILQKVTDDEPIVYTPRRWVYPVPVTYHHLLPATASSGSPKVDFDLLWKLGNPSNIEDDTEDTSRYFWPFFHTQFVVSNSQASHLVQGRNVVGEEGFRRWGNAAAFHYFWYHSTVLLLSVPQTETTDDDEGETKTPDDSFLSTKDVHSIIYV